MPADFHSLNGATIQAALLSIGVHLRLSVAIHLSAPF
jgi:hypothetical protein